jgi:small-conductance mechanosensitive channel
VGALLAQDNNASDLTVIDAQIGKLSSLLSGNVWINRYQDQKDYMALQSEKAQIEAEMKRLAAKRDRVSQERYAHLEERGHTLQTKIDLLGEVGASPYETLSKVEPIAEPPNVKHPFAIVAGLGYLRETDRALKNHAARLETLHETIALEYEMQTLLEQRNALSASLGVTSDRLALNEIVSLIAVLSNVEEVFSVALSVQHKRFASYEAQVKAQIEAELVKLITILIATLIVIAFAFLAKLGVRRAVSDTNRQFGINRAINIATFSIVLLIALFSYMDNIAYFVTVLGFISAGIAIAMKDWFMSLLGWFVIVFGGSIHIGDRIRVTMSNNSVVGDVLEIGLTRIMLFEDVTLATFDENRRAGRIIHIPNNYIFTNMLQNYTYNELQTVWDGIDLVITFDSNHKKAQKIAKEITAKHAIGYTDLTRKHYSNLRARYNMRSVSVEPRVFTFAHAYGMKVSIWYLTNSYATLALRSVISQEVVEAFNNAENITIAYPTYAIGSSVKALAPEALETTPSLFE